MPSIVGKMAKSKGLSVNIESDALSGHTFKMHFNRPELFKHIADKKWDYVILQGFSRELAHDNEHIERETIPYLEKIIDAVKSNSPSTKMFFYQTWGYNNGYPHREEIDTFDKMSTSIQAGYEYLSKKFDIEIIPVGIVWGKVRKSLGDKLYQEDGEHPSVFGSYTVASTFFRVLFDISFEGAYKDYRIDKETAKIIYDSVDEISN